MNIKRFCPGAPLPERKTEGAAGYDLPACAYYDLKDSAFKDASGNRITTSREGCILIPLGWGFEIPVGWKGDLKPRSSTNHWLIDGTIDWDYRGQVFAKTTHHLFFTAFPTLNLFDRVAQISFVEVLIEELNEVDELSQTARGTGGHGSTGR
jgi:dUTP pyrophosphatase